MTTIRVSLGSRSYPIQIADSYARLPQSVRGAGITPRPVVIVSHAGLQRRFGAALAAPLRRAGYPASWVMVPESETSKSLAVAEQVIAAVGRQAAMRVPLLIAFGGGVVGDLTGFVAAVYRRGVPYVQVPTTLLAQVDSAIGGKTGVDLRSGKNLVGAFHQPRLVFNHLGIVASLPLRQRRSGLSEVIKYGVMADPALFRFLERRMEACVALRPAAVRMMVERSCRIKARVVSRDERETTGLRAQLNFGHTLGHALEAATAYRRYTHGEAIAIGMACASALAVALGRWRLQDDARLVGLLGRAGLPLRASGVSFASVQRALTQDKKFIHGRPRWVLPTRIGRVVVTEQIPAALMRATVRRFVGS